MEELEDRLKELKNGVQLQQRKNQELEELRSSLHQELSIYKSVCPSRGGRGGLAAGEPGAPRPAHAEGTGTAAAVETPTLCHVAMSWKVLCKIEAGAAFQEAGAAT